MAARAITPTAGYARPASEAELSALARTYLPEAAEPRPIPEYAPYAPQLVPVPVLASQTGRWEDGSWAPDLPAPGAMLPEDGYGADVSGEPVAPPATQKDEAIAPIAKEGEPRNGGGWRHDLPYRWELRVYGLLFASALAMRLFDLGSRAVHHDESLHGLFAFNLANGEGYIHNPLMHGPFLFHITAASFFLFGDSDFTLRLVEALFGSVLIFVPLLLRPRLGNIGALLVASMLAFSPTLLYFSRFARNDIFMAVWTLALVGVIWRYLDDGKPKWLYFTAALMALGFATKETQYLVVAIIGLALLAMARRDIGGWLWGQRSFKDFSRPGSMTLVIGALTLPLLGAFSGVTQSLFGLTLAAVEGTPGLATGSPDGAGVAVAAVLTGALVIVSVFVGLRWRFNQWVKILAIFWAITFVLFSTFGTNLDGVGTGIWQSLGYWVGQQEVARGSQPWYYYFIIISVYEFLPWTVAIGASFYYALRGDVFTRFLVFWAVGTFIAYTLAGEKMPWLTVNIVLPIIVLAGKALGDAVTSFEWRKALDGGGMFLYAGVPLFLVLLWRSVFFETNDGVGGLLELWIMLAIIGFLAYGLWLLIRRIGRPAALTMSLTVVVVIMFGLTLRAGWIATYVNSDVPNELLIYTQTSPAVPQLAQEIRNAGTLTGENLALPVTVDSSDGFTWPWAWYFRNYDNTDYPGYDNTGKLDGPPEGSVILVNVKNRSVVEDTIAEGDFTEGRRFAHRQWFPEDYRGLTATDFFGTVIDRSRWQGAIDFFLFRTLPSPIGGVDSIVYFKDDIPLNAVE